jgi:ATP-dependent helicase/nuclease subunit A
MTSITTHETVSVLTYEFGEQKTASPAANKTTSQKDLIEIKAELKLPIKTLPSTEHMIAPSRANQHQNVFEAADDPLDTEHGQTRGIVIHHALDLLSRKNALSPQKTLQQLVSETSMSAGNTDLKNWLEEAVETTKAVQFEEIFTPPEDSQTHNEMPLLYEADNQPVYGLIDRLVIGEKEILLIDYKTHAHVTRETAKTNAESFREQMRLYKEGVQRIWPDHTIRTGLLFTVCAELVWLN